MLNLNNNRSKSPRLVSKSPINHANNKLNKSSHENKNGINNISNYAN
jgi:hypothetical protein